MKKLSIKVIFLTLFMFSFTFAQTSVELISNNDFESGMDGWVFNVDTTGGTNAIHELDTTSVISGKNSLKYTINKSVGGTPSSRICLYVENISMEEGQDYNMSFKIRSTKAYPEEWDIPFWTLYKDTTLSSYHNYGTVLVAKEDSIIQYDSTYTATFTASDAIFSIDLGYFAVSDTVTFWIDDVSLTTVVFPEDGTEADPIQISSLEDLKKLSDYPSLSDKYFVQTSDIDASPTADWIDFGTVVDSTMMGWKPIASFKGSYDGGGFAIDGLTIIRQEAYYVGLFARLSGATVKDLGLTNVDMSIIAPPSEKGHTLGGLCGQVGSSTTISGCYVTGELEANGNAGGLLGRVNGSDISITDSYSDADLYISAGQATGGFVGRLDGGSITNCYSDGTYGSDFYLQFGGGFVGKSYGGTIDQCYSLVDVKFDTVMAGAQAGGFAGKVKNTITNCYSLANIFAADTSAASARTYGFAYIIDGSNALIENCYTAGTNDAGRNGANAFGVVPTDNAVVTGCYYDSDTYGGVDGVSAIAKTTTEMKTADTFVGWDFASTWKTAENYPNLRNNSNPDLEPTYADGDMVEPNGSGTEANPYQIKSLENLSWLVQHDTTVSNAYFVQTADIDMSKTAYWDDLDDNADGDLYNDPNDKNTEGNNEGWMPIGSGDSLFTGTYDGAGYNLDGLTLNRTGTYSMAMFSNVCGATFKNVELVGVSITATAYTIGGLVGTAVVDSPLYDLNIENCSVIGGTITGSGSYQIGGLIGDISYDVNAIITDCETNVTVTTADDGKSGESVGGLIGIYKGKGTITGCNSKGLVDVSSTTVKTISGAFLGQITYSDEDRGIVISKCYSIGNIIGANVAGYSPAAGFIGLMYQGTVDQCFSTGDVDAGATQKSGGFIGYVRKTTSHITNCYSTGKVTTTELALTGTFIGHFRGGATINNCYTVGTIEGASLAEKGFIALLETAVDTSTNFFDSTVTSQAIGRGALPKTTAEMMADSIFTDAGWDFTDVWEIVDNQYPTLKHNRLPLFVMPTKMSFEVMPNALSESKISMTATIAAASGYEVEYMFECITDPGHSSAWQTSRTYVDSMLAMNTRYEYTVIARVKDGEEVNTVSDAVGAITDYINDIVYGEFKGECVMEAENADIFANGDVASYKNDIQLRWEADTTEVGSVDGYVYTPAMSGANATWDNATILRWKVYIQTPGEYYIAVRRNNKNDRRGYASYGVDDAEKQSEALGGRAAAFTWVRGDSSLGVLEKGVHNIEVRRVKDGLMIDRVMISAILDSLPVDGSIVAGPAESGDTSVTALEEFADNMAPRSYSLEQNYPNPFNPVTTIIFNLSKSGKTELSIYNVLGQKVATVVNKELTAGSHKYQFKASNLSSGIYFYKIQSNDFVQIKKMMLLK